MANIIRITESQITLDGTYQFVLALKNDTAHTMPPIAKAAGMSGEQSAQLFSCYEEFCNGLHGALLDSFASGSLQIHVFDDTPIRASQIEKAKGCFAVSLDPFVGAPDAFTLGLSRHFAPDGKTLLGLKARPGYAPVPEQLSALTAAANGQPLAIIEDDIFSGFTMMQAVQLLRDAGFTAARIIPGIQIGDVSVLSDAGILVDPVHRYLNPKAASMDLGDYRDLLVGADGLVLQFSHAEKGRLPFIKPFMSPHERLGIPEQVEGAFSAAVLELNKKFFADVAAKTGITLTAAHMTPASVQGLAQRMTIPADKPMAAVVQELLAA